MTFNVLLVSDSHDVEPPKKMPLCLGEVARSKAAFTKLFGPPRGAQQKVP